MLLDIILKFNLLKLVITNHISANNVKINITKKIIVIIKK